jgi:hypothetical protein
LVGRIRKIAKGIDECAVEIEDVQTRHSPYSAYDVGVSHTFTRTTGSPSDAAWR